jgi:hypothetical protein
MTLTARVHNGHFVTDESAALPEGPEALFCLSIRETGSTRRTAPPYTAYWC